MKPTTFLGSRHVRVFFSFGAIQAMQLVVPLLAFPWLSRKLGEDVFGLLMYICLTPPIVCLFMEWGLTLGGARQAADLRGDEKALGRLLGDVFAAKIILACCCALGAAALSPLIPRAAEYPGAYALAVALGVARGASPLWFYQGAGRGVKRLAVWDVVSSFVALSLVFLFINAPDEWERYLAFTAACKAVPYLSLDCALYRAYSPGLDFRRGLRILRETRTLFVGSFFTMIYNNGSQLALGYFLTTAQMGIFVAANKMLRAVGAALTPFVQTVFPEICVLRSRDPQTARRVLRLSFLSLFLLMCLCSGLLFILAPYIINIALGPGYGAAVDVFRIMILSAPLLACDCALGVQILAPYRLESRQIRVQGTAAVASLALAALLAETYGLIGASFLPLAIELILTLGYWRAVRKYCPGALLAD